MNDEKILDFLYSPIWAEHQKGSAAEAYVDLLVCDVSERPSSYVEMAERWKVTRQTASKWCAEMRTLGLDPDFLIEEAKDYRYDQRYSEREEIKKRAEAMPKRVGTMPTEIGTTPTEIGTDEYELLDDGGATLAGGGQLCSPACPTMFGGQRAAQASIPGVHEMPPGVHEMPTGVHEIPTGVHENNRCKKNLHTDVKSFYTDVNETNSSRAHEVKLINNIHNIQNIQHSQHRVYAREGELAEEGEGLDPAEAAVAPAAVRARDGQAAVGTPAGASGSVEQSCAHAQAAPVDPELAPTPDEVDAYINELGGALFSGQFFVDYYTARSQWNEVNVQPRVWRAMVRKWRENDRKRPEAAQRRYGQGRPTAQPMQCQHPQQYSQQQGYGQGRPTAQPMQPQQYSPHQGYGQGQPGAQPTHPQQYSSQQGYGQSQSDAQQLQAQPSADEMVRAMIGNIYGTTYSYGATRQSELSYLEQLRQLDAAHYCNPDDGLPF